MPFRSIGGGLYKSPSGRTWTKKQVRAYYATNGFSTGFNKGNPSRKRTRKSGRTRK